MPKRMKNQNTYIHGSHNELCDVCGFKYKTEDMHTRWDGLRVCHDDYEERHPMDFFRSMPDNQNVNDPDADDTDNSGVNTTLPSVTGTITSQTNFEDDTITPLDTSAAFSEGDGTNVKYTAIGLPASLILDSSTGIITGTINSLAATSSPYTVTITLTTSASAVFSVSTSFTWTVVAVELVLGYLAWMNPDTIVNRVAPVSVETWENDPSASGGSIYDMSRSGNIIPPSTQNGLAVVRSTTATVKYMQSGGEVIVPTGFTLFVVGQFEAATVAQHLFDYRIAAASSIEINTDGTDVSISGGTIGSKISRTGFGTVGDVYAIRVAAGNNRYRISGGAWASDASATTQALSWNMILRNRDTTLNTIGWVGEIILYDSAMSDSDMNKVFNYLLNKWGIT